MAEDKDKSQQTEEPTQKKIEDARKKGQIVKSREPATAISFLLFGLLAIAGVGSYAMTQLNTMMHTYLGGQWHDVLTAGGVQRILVDIIIEMAVILLPFFIPIILLSLLVSFALGQPVLTFDPLKPKMERISFIKGMKRMFSLRSLVELLKSVMKLVIIAVLCWMTVSFYETAALNATFMEPIAIADLAVDSSVWLMLTCGALFFFIALADVLYQRWEHLKGLRMSIKEVRDEMKESEGDPHQKSRIRQIQMDQSRQRMMSDVPTADVVITNPTHLAIALKYEHGGSSAPVVVAKGQGKIAEKIRQIARENHVPIQENKLLARSLFKSVKVGGEIPEHLYEAVAIVLAEIFSLRGSM
ncbi:MAG: flagellar biosynthesis protein FlhB [Flavobacteriales bacterium]